MNPYLRDTRYATERLVELLSAEDNRLIESKRIAERMKEKAKEHFEWMKESGVTGERVFELLELETGAEEFNSRATAISQLITTLPTSLSVVAGALLQIAKQGISITHGGLGACPNGRQVAGVSLKNIIWQARNQAMHFEEGTYSPAVTSCFQLLATHAGAAFTLGGHSLAHEVTTLLQWKSYQQYEQDMVAILSCV